VNAYSQNLILNALPQAELDLLSPSLERVHVHTHIVLAQPGERIGHVYFPVSCMISLVTVLDEGVTIESATVGNEGMSGLPVFHGLDFATSRAIVQMEGDAYKLSATVFKDGLARAPRLHEALGRYAEALISMLGQSGACNGQHSVEQRLARWLLTIRDRVGKDEFSITQEFLGQMLGSYRPTVTLAAGALQRAGFITYHHGHVRILDRPSLEDVACECYGIIRSLYSRTYQFAGESAVSRHS
jgi:CRP-like cAMP-binding protein